LFQNSLSFLSLVSSGKVNAEMKAAIFLAGTPVRSDRSFTTGSDINE
jgi:hypothetical protein